MEKKPILFIAIIFVFFILVVVSSASEKAESIKKSGQIGIGEQGIIILVEFPDVKHHVSREFVTERFFTKLNSYVQEMSYKKVSIGGDITEKWYKMPHPISYYNISPRNLEVDKSRVRNLIDDTFSAMEKDIDFSKYAFSAIFMGARRDEYGMIGLCGYPGMLGWSTKDVLKTKSNQVVKGVAIYSYQAHLGTLFHDIAHILGSVKQGKRMVPCLYDHDLQAKPGPIRQVFIESIINMGFWDPMSCHFYKYEIPPPGISSWTKMRLNWMDSSKIRVVKPSEKAELLLGPLEDGASEILAIKIPISETTYYLIENRQPIGFDRNLPGSGVLIMFADDNIPECRRGKAPVKLMDADPSIPYLEGATFDIGKKDIFVDEKNGLKIKLIEKKGTSYKILITPYSK